MGPDSFDLYGVLDLFILLLIGIGPKIALLPYLDITAPMSKATKARVARQMLKTAGTIGVVLLILGELLRKLEGHTFSAKSHAL